MGGSYFFMGSYLEKYGKFRETAIFSGRIWPDWGNTAWADMAGLGSIGLISNAFGNYNTNEEHPRFFCDE